MPPSFSSTIQELNMSKKTRYVAIGVSGPLLVLCLYGELFALLIVIFLSFMTIVSSWCCYKLLNGQKKSVLFSVLFVEIISVLLLCLIYPHENPEQKMWFPVAILFFVPYTLLSILTVAIASFFWNKAKGSN